MGAASSASGAMARDRLRISFGTCCGSGMTKASTRSSYAVSRAVEAASGSRTTTVPVGAVSTSRQTRSGRTVRSALQRSCRRRPPRQTRPRPAAVAIGLGDVARQHVVDHDHRGGVGEALGVDEVAQRVLREVHAVDEREVDHRLVEVRQRMLAGEELVARRAHQVEVAEQLPLDVEGRVDADRPRPRPGHAGAGAHPDLQVGPGLEQLVKASQQVVASHPATLPQPRWRLRRGSAGSATARSRSTSGNRAATTS